MESDEAVLNIVQYKMENTGAKTIERISFVSVVYSMPGRSICHSCSALSRECSGCVGAGDSFPLPDTLQGWQIQTENLFKIVLRESLFSCGSGSAETNADSQHCFKDHASHLGNCTLVNVCHRLVMHRFTL